MTSGNPAKRSQAAIAQEMKKRLRDCVTNKKWMCYRPFPNTEVRVLSTDMDEALEINEWMTPPTAYDPSGLTAYLQSWILLCSALSQEKKWAEALTDAMLGMVRAYEEGMNDNNEWRQAYFTKHGHKPPGKIKFYTEAEVERSRAAGRRRRANV